MRSLLCGSYAKANNWEVAIHKYSTFSAAIDENLYENTERVWRLFREIAEGLAHMHQQGMIHRDLKPVNIFLDSRDQIKIGDFGLATTSFLALQSQGLSTESDFYFIALFIFSEHFFRTSTASAYYSSGH